MTVDEPAETTGELEVSVAGLIGRSIDDLHMVVTVCARGGGSDEIATTVARLSHVDPVTWSAQAQYREWLVDLAQDQNGTLYMVGADGSLRVGVGALGRRYGLPTRGGLASVWCSAPGDLLVCGASTLGRIHLEPGRIRCDVVDDEGVGEARVVAGPGPGRVDGAIAVGTRGALWRYDGVDWTAHETTATETLLDIAWAEDDRAYVVGAEGSLFVWDGARLQLVLRDPRLAWHGAAWWRGTLYLAAGRDGLWRLDNGVVTAVKAVPVFHVAAIAGQLFGWGGSVIARFDGQQWSGGPLHLA
jgi:hypothetical protein